ncbi:MAG TPA: DUF1499 domain-containing protein [Candidatus Binataceae bacterium]|nr:DUF1499 domain-containing protein [Candidatus Binataceae bacterium]
MIPAWLAFFDGLLAIALVAAGIIGAHFYMIDGFFGFQLFVFGFLLSIIGFIMGLIGIAITRSAELRSARQRANVGLAFSVAVAIPLLVLAFSVRNYPAINDITTDFDNPPEFTHAQELASNRGRDMRYDKARCAERQQSGYGPLGPIVIAGDAAGTFEKVKAVAAQMPQWEITTTDPKSMTLEGVGTTSLFRFQDDFVIQVRPGEAGRSLVEMRSRSRVGIGDFGSNYNRIVHFFDRLKASAS